ncbi:MAG: VWA domain-containing protein, partial [Bacteroidetes bacterium]|nr:VWA domain-containing protein [Bacteroidota bacterium]
VTARFNHPFIKIFEEERELTVMLLIDVSGSNEFGSKQQLKKMIAAEIAAVLAFSAIQNNDKVGVIFFSDQVEKFIPPKKGTSHILRIIREVISFKPQHRSTDIGEGLRFLTSAIKKRSTAFLISDFISDGFEQPMKIAARKHDLIALRITDKREDEIPPIGLVKFSDAESGKEFWVDTSSQDARNRYRHWIRKKTELLNSIFTKCGVDNTLIYTDEDYVRPLMKLFKKRSAR